MHIVPTAPDHIHITRDFYFGEEVPGEEARESADFIERALLEDSVLVEAVQRGVRARKVSAGRLVLEHERAVEHFDALVWHALMREVGA